MQRRKALNDNPNIRTAVGDSLGGAVALELQKHHPGLKVRTDGAPVIDLKGAIQPTWSVNTERYRNFGDPISMFDSSAHTPFYPQFYDQTVSTHQYQNNANNLRTRCIIYIYTNESTTTTTQSLIRLISRRIQTKRRRSKTPQQRWYDNQKASSGNRQTDDAHIISKV